VEEEEDLFGAGTLAKGPRRVWAGGGITLTGLTRGQGSRADSDGDPSGREKALYRLGRVSTAAYFSASRLKEGGGDMSASIKT
jgi:hypothetical protein